MKIKILSGILLISGVSFFTSCHGDLNVIQPSQFTSLSMWTEESDATSGKWSIYSIPFCLFRFAQHLWRDALKLV